MKTNKYTRVCYVLFVSFICSLVILTACKPNESASRPFPDIKEWDLLVISSSMNWGVGEYYAKLIEADIKVKVNLHDCWVGGLDIGVALENLQNNWSWSSNVGDKSCYKPLPDLIKEAEVMVLFGGPLASSPADGSWDIPEVFHSCYKGGYSGKYLQPDFETYKDRMLNSCAPETYETYKTQLGAFLEEIDKIREGRPIILRMTDMYIATHAYWVKNSVNDVCTTCTGRTSEVIRQVAEEYRVPVASTMIAFNGKDYAQEPPASYFLSDGHLSDAGSQYVASLLQQTGYAYAGK